MNTLIRSLTLAGLAALTSATAMAGGATVTFTHPENYSDFPYSEVDRDWLLKETADHFIKLAARLPAGQDLKIEVLDYDLAGDRKIGYAYLHDFRILKGRADWPSMNVRYTLTENGQVIKQGEERIRDMAYLNHINRYFSGDPLRYEKQMVEEWFRERFGVSRR
ncbi:DUF3016 domain-containing protein [Pseudoduganella sp. GCM10020061]|jgi:hypothetical protein|uniref:DUF3016 domain-containing protein n=1 Tax=Pseudoduganella sp. GCM10020061 TaxID=3317345 RepID=UPI003638CA74